MLDLSDIEDELGTPISPIGPKNAAVMIIGEAPGLNEEAKGIPFVGKSGQLLKAMLSEVGFEWSQLRVTNVFMQRPPKNDIRHFFADSKAAAGHGGLLLPLQLPDGKKYVKQKYLPRISQLRLEIHECAPSLVITLGGTALWAAAQITGISTHRGAIRRLVVEPTGKEPHECLLLPTLHPAAVLRQYQQRGIFQADIEKAYRAATGTLKHKPGDMPEIIFDPTRENLKEWGKEIMQAPRLGVDVETAADQISMIGFAVSPRKAYVIPIFNPVTWQSYWPTADDEIMALGHIKQWLQGPAQKVFQNGLYDMQRIWRGWRFAPRNVFDDTMLLHHSQQPEMQKGLGFLSSIYLDHPAWKSWRQNRSTKKDNFGKEE